MPSWKTYARAVQDLSAGLGTSELLPRAVEVLLENVGAQKGAIVVCHQGRLQVEAIRDAAVDEQARLVSLSLEGGEVVAESVVRLCASTLARVLVDDPLGPGDVRLDPYVVRRKPGPMLCTPILRHGQLLGLVYLESGRAAGSFTPGQLELLEALVAQLAIAMENAERCARQQAELDEIRASVKAKTEFLARVSHELRTPLNSIINIPEGLLERYLDRLTARCTACGAQFLYDVEETWVGGTPCPSCQTAGGLEKQPLTLTAQEADDVVHCTRLVAVAGKHLLGVVNDILDLSKLEMGKTHMELEPIELDGPLGEVLEIINAVALRHGVKLEKSLEGGRRLAEVDPVRFRQILYNLIHNAIKFSPTGATVHVTVRGAEEEIFLSIRDEGVGISRADQSRLFQNFSQVGSHSARTSAGFGLGLAITKTLVELHHGQIWVESEEGQGSTFLVRLPRKSPPAGSETTPCPRQS